MTALSAEPAFTTGDVAGRPVAVASAVVAPRTLESWIEDKYAPFAITLARSPGFIAARLIECVNTGRRCVLVSVTLWEDVAWYRAWTAGAGFAAACTAARGNPDGSRAARADADRHGMLEVARFDFPFRRGESTRTMTRLEGPLLARLEGRFGIDPHGACFRVALELGELCSA